MNVLLKWVLLFSLYLLIFGIKAQTITSAEYFVGKDPGVGKGIAITVTVGSSLDDDFNINSTGLNAGLNKLNIRVKQDNGLWSSPKIIFFYVIEDREQPALQFATDIIAAEYFFNIDPGVGKGEEIPLQKTSDLNLNWTAPTTGLSIGEHRLHIRTKSQDGVWSPTKSTNITINDTNCIMPVTDFSFDTVDVNTNINLVDRSSNVVEEASYAWDVLNDGTVESNDPAFTTQFADRGVFAIKLTVTNPDGCASSAIRYVIVTDGFPKTITLTGADSLLTGNTNELMAPEGFTYLWNTGETSQSISVAQSGDYFVYLTSNGLTHRSETSKIRFFEPITAQLQIFNTTSGQNNGGAFLQNIDTDGLPLDLLWSTGNSGVRSLTDLAPGSYTVTLITSLQNYVIPFDIADVALGATSIVKAEYFTQTDPGPGNGTPINIYQSDELTADFSINLTDFNPGLYKIYTRVKSANGFWSIPLLRTFYVLNTREHFQEVEPNEILTAEYFFDKDPGPGKGIEISQVSGDQVDIDFSHLIIDLSGGLHTLFVRVKQTNEVWSSVSSVTFFVIGDRFNELISFKTDIIEAEYFFDQDPGAGKGIKMPIQKGQSISNRPWVAPTDGLITGEHTLNIRVRNQEGFWNIIKSIPFTVNTNPCVPPKADFAFDTVGINTLIGLRDLSSGLSDSVSYAWDIYADGSIESTHPLFDTLFTEKGIYPIKLTVVNLVDSCFTSIVRDILITDEITTELLASKGDSLVLGDSVTLTAPEGYNYEWNTGETTRSIAVTASGTYFVWLSADGIIFKSQVKSFQFFNPISAEIATFSTIIGSENGAASIRNIDTDGLPFEISWSTGQTNVDRLTGLASGSYQAEIRTVLDTLKFFFSISISQLLGTEIIAAEYFFNEDPGPGNGVPITAYIGDEIDFNFSPDITGLDVGIQRMYVRAKQANGFWGLARTRFFYIINSDDRIFIPVERNLVSAEYFIDEDPGAGNGLMAPIQFGKQVDQNFDLDVTNISLGLHFLYLRAQQDDGMWSSTVRIPFFVTDPERNAKVFFNTDIIAAEYFFNADPGPGNGFPIPIQKTDSLYNRPWSASTNELSVGKHQLHIRVKNQDGIWNSISSTRFFVYPSNCNLPLVDFSFDTVGVGIPVTLVDLSENVATDAIYAWDILGDGQIESSDIDFNPVFDEPGVYPIRLTVTNTEGCFTSIVKDVLVSDLLPSTLLLSANDSLLVGDTLFITAPDGFVYEWSTGETSQILQVINSGSYFAYLKTTDIVFKSEIINARFFRPLDVDLSVFNATNGLANGTARLENPDADGLPLTIAWSQSSFNTPFIGQLTPGDYSVTLNTFLQNITLPFSIEDIQAVSGSITSFEYFIDQDPGPGLGTPIITYQDLQVAFQEKVTIGQLEEGTHEIYFRAQQDNGLWSLPIKQRFLIIKSRNFPDVNFGGRIVYSEYGFDNLPVPGQGVPISVTSAFYLDESLSVDISNLSTGSHKLFIQSRDESGNWSFSKPQEFVICETIPPPPDIADAQGCPGDNITLTVNNGSGFYRWYDENGEVIQASNNNTLVLNSVTKSRNIQVSQGDNNGCYSARKSVSVQISDVEVFAGPDTETFNVIDELQLTLQFPQGGVWSGSQFVNSQGVFLPKNAGLGNFTVTYSLDTAGCVISDQKRVIVRETDNVPPVIQNQEFEISENSAIGSIIGLLMASDADQDMLSFFGRNSIDTAFIAIHPVTGEITVKDSSFNDAETNSELLVEVMVRDLFYESYAQVTIHILDVNEPPLVADQLFEVAENSPSGTEISILTATDPEGDERVFSIISGNEAGAFSMTSAGVLTVADSSQFDFETFPGFTLSAQVTDGEFIIQFTVTVDVLDVNEPPMVIDQHFELTENSPFGTEIGILTAIDPEGDELVFSIISGNEAGAFSMTSAGGLTVSDASQFDFESNPDFTLTVQVTDSEFTVVTLVTITLIDVLEFISEPDSLALVALYVSTGGPNWSNNTGWLSTPIENWHGVSIDNDEIIAINLSSNNLVGNLSTDFMQISGLRELNLFNNEITSIPILSEIPGIVEIDISGNKLQFNDLERIIGSTATIAYSPQKVLLERGRFLEEIGSSRTLNREIAGSQNQYQWFKDGETINNVGSSIEVLAESFESEGDFYATVTNDLVPGLTITTNIIEFRVSSLARDRISLLEIHDALNGVSWSNGSDWPQLDINEWFGVIIENNRVVGVDLKNNNLKGQLPEAINDMLQLRTIDFSGNEIVGLPIISLLELTSFDVRSNLLNIDDIEINLPLDGFLFNPQKEFPVDDSLLVVDQGTDVNLKFELAGDAILYQWYFNNISLDEANQFSFLIDSITIGKMGVYISEATSAKIQSADPSFRLVRKPQEVLAKARIFGIVRGFDNQPLLAGDMDVYAIPEANGKYDTTATVLVANGLFEVTDLILGNYTCITRSGDLFYIPTYIGNSEDWISARTIELVEDIEVVDYNMLFRPEDPTGGEGLVDLTVESEIEGEEDGRIENRRRVRKAGCSLRRRTTGAGRPEEDVFVLVAYKETDDNGQVSFGTLPVGYYRLNIQYPGIPMDPTSFIEFEITEEEADIQYVLSAVVTEDAIVVELIEALSVYKKYFVGLNVFPNPAMERFSIQYSKLMSDQVRVAMTDVNGREIKDIPIEKGKNKTIEMDVTAIPEGIYFLNFYDAKVGNKPLTVFKIILRK